MAAARFAAVVVEELSHQIIGGTLAEGDVIPTEPTLCEEFGFSRTVIREGLKLLRATRARARGAGPGHHRAAPGLVGSARP